MLDDTDGRKARGVVLYSATGEGTVSLSISVSVGISGWLEQVLSASKRSTGWTRWVHCLVCVCVLIEQSIKRGLDRNPLDCTGRQCVEEYTHT